MKIFTFALVLCLSSVGAAAQQCSTERESAHDEAQRSESVVLATVTAATPVPEAWDFLDGVNYTIHVDAKLHGKAHANTELTVFSENSTHFFPMYVGAQYVLYLQPKYGRFQVDNCGNSHATEQIHAEKKQAPHVTAKGF